MTHLDTPRVSELIGRSIDHYERSYGATMPALAGLVARALIARNGGAPREMAQVAVKNHANAVRNPYAHFQRAVTVDEVLDSRMVADPLRLLHCCPISDGAAAVVLTADRAAVRITGIGQGMDTLALRHRDALTSFRASRAAARADRRVRVAAHGARRGEAGAGACRARAVDRRARNEQLGDAPRGAMRERDMRCVAGSPCVEIRSRVAPRLGPPTGCRGLAASLQ